jgi:hypothetical protein
MKAAAIFSIALGLVLLPSSLLAAKQKEQKAADGKVWDSGSFGIFVNGKRVGTEKFKIQQHGDSSVTTSELKMQQGAYKASQKSEMELARNGDLQSYTWESSQPKKEQCRVDTKDQLLIEHITPADQKPLDIQHLLPASTAVLDDNFFSQREVLLWHYLAACSRVSNQLACKPATIPVLIPQQHVSVDATLQLLGHGQGSPSGAEQQLNKVELTLHTPQQVVWMNDKSKDSELRWVLWVDENYRIVKITVSNSNVEILRDAGNSPVSIGALSTAPGK